MNLNIEIEDNNLVNLSSGAKIKLSEQTKIYAVDLLKEAILIEEADRQEGANSEITSSIIMQAASSKKGRNNLEVHTPVWLKITKFVSAISSAIAGFLFDIDGFQNNRGGLIGFLVFFAISCVSLAILILKEK